MRLAFATGNNGEFSLNGGLPWGAPIKEDMKHFVDFCEDKVMVMGYKTWVSLPQIVKNKYECLVVFQREDQTFTDHEGAKVYVPDDEFLVKYLGLLNQRENGMDSPEFCVIGGTAIVDTCLSNLELFDSVLHTVVTPSIPFQSSSRISMDKTKLYSSRFADKEVYVYNTHDYIVEVNICY